MREINLPYSVAVRAPPGDVGVDLEKVGDIAAIARHNKQAVIECALAIEANFERLISYYFFGESDEMKDAFTSVILHSDWCTFSAKRRLVMHIINERDLCRGADKNEVDLLFRDVIRYRNAFTHGRFLTDGTTFRLKYFEQHLRVEELTDDYLIRVEGRMRVAHNKTDWLIAELEGHPLPS
jgi:hypothetical protein